VGWCGLVVFRLPEYLYYLQHCIDGIFNLWLPPMYSIVIIPRCFVFCMFLGKFHVLWARATRLFSDAHVEISTLGFSFTGRFHEFLAFIYVYVLIQSILFLVYVAVTVVLVSVKLIVSLWPYI
jgi:hypothetical protein